MAERVSGVVAEEDPNRRTGSEKRLDEVAADETARTGHESPAADHRFSLRRHGLSVSSRSGLLRDVVEAELLVRSEVAR